MEERTIQINDIVADEALMMRELLNQKTVIQYAEFMRDGCEFPPIDVMEVDGELLLVDGFHRVSAYKRRHETKVKAYVHQGTRDDAILLAVRADATTSLKRTSADKRKCVQSLLITESWRDKSNVWVGQQAGVDEGTVRKERKKMDSSLGISEPEIPVSRLGRDGKRYAAKQSKKSASPTAGTKPEPPPAYKPPPPMPRLTREQIGAPAPGTEDEQDPDSPPGVTRAVAFTRKHGHVHLVPLDQKIKLKNDTAAKDMCMAIRDFGKAAEAFLKRDLLEPDVFFATLEAMTSRALWASKFEQQLPALREAFERINRCLELLHSRQIDTKAAE